jgi:hypothetical protein
MKLTYAVEIDLKRAEGRNLSKADVAALVMHEIVRLQDTLPEALYTESDRVHGGGTWYEPLTVTVWPFEGSEPAEGHGMAITDRKLS